MATLQDAGRIAIAKAVAALPIHIAIGRGLPAWDATPAQDPTDATALVDEIGRRLVADVGYCTPDPAGDIELPSGARYARSATPTSYLYLRCPFDYADGQGETVREIAVFMGTKTDPALPPGQRFFTPAQVTDAGAIYLVERRVATQRTGLLRMLEEIIIPF